MQSEYQIKKEIVEVGRRIYERGFVAANDGNITVRIDENTVLTTPTGVSKGFMTTDMIIKVSMEGKVLSGKLKPSSELKMHLDIYKQRPDVNAVVHAHPPMATAFAVAGIPLDKFVLPEIVINLGSIPLAKYGTPSTDEIPLAVREYLENYDAFLLENHGALTVGSDLLNAYFKMESMELFAQISINARQLGREREIPPQQVDKLLELRKKMEVKGRHPGCMDCGRCTCKANMQTKASTKLPAEKPDEEQIGELVKRITQDVIRQLG